LLFEQSEKRKPSLLLFEQSEKRKPGVEGGGVEGGKQLSGPKKSRDHAAQRAVCAYYAAVGTHAARYTGDTMTRFDVDQHRFAKARTAMQETLHPRHRDFFNDARVAPNRAKVAQNVACLRGLLPADLEWPVTRLSRWLADKVSAAAQPEERLLSAAVYWAAACLRERSGPSGDPTGNAPRSDRQLQKRDCGAFLRQSAEVLGMAPSTLKAYARDVQEQVGRAGLEQEFEEEAQAALRRRGGASKRPAPPPPVQPPPVQPPPAPPPSESPREAPWDRGQSPREAPWDRGQSPREAPAPTAKKAKRAKQENAPPGTPSKQPQRTPSKRGASPRQKQRTPSKRGPPRPSGGPAPRSDRQH
jgi:hypothetical protein